MKIYTNNNYEILSLDVQPSHYDHCFETEQTKEELFGDLCDVVIRGHKYEPQYAILLDNNGGYRRDEETGELLYRLDEDGNKILSGYACYPFVDYQTLMLIQKQYEDFQLQLQTFNAQMAYMSMMSGIEMEVENE